MVSKTTSRFQIELCVLKINVAVHDFTGIVFIINGGFYAVTAPIWGWMVDRFLHPKLSALIGSILIAIAFSLIGPVSFLPFET